MKIRPVFKTTVILVGLSLGLIIFTALAFGFERFLLMRQSGAQTSGNIHVEGLNGPVDIIRDAQAIPHIFGKSDQDVFFALGFVHAQDRLWQMEMSRRAGQGRLSEVLGQSTLETDQYLRTLQLQKSAQNSYDNLSPQTKLAYEAYARGVNAFIQAHPRKLSPEFTLLFYRPEPWVPSDSILILKLLGLRLATNMSDELLRAGLMTRLDEKAIGQFFTPYPDDGPRSIGADLALLYEKLDLPRQLAALPPEFAPSQNFAGASNNWVVSGAHTKSGKPLLANDPHLGMSAPSVWYLAHLKLKSGNVVGATLPGVPGIILGRNDFISWGFTNTGPDVEDLYIEEILPGDPTRYRTPEGSAAFKAHDEIIKLRFGKAVALPVRVTRHGPVLPQDISANAGFASQYVLSLRWAGLEAPDRTADASLKVMAASNWESFVQACQDFHAPMQNIVYADVAGNIGFIAPGRVPIRGPQHETMGLRPARGWIAENDWQGFIPFDQLPKSFNPKSGKFASTNNKIVADDYPYFLTSHWDAPYRQERVEDLLESDEPQTVMNFALIQKDSVSYGARALKEAMLPRTSAYELSEMRDALGIWNGDMSMPGPEPLLFTAWLRAFTRALYADEFGPYFERAWAPAAPFVLDVLSNKNGAGHYCDNITTKPVETCDDLLAASLVQAREELETAHKKRWKRLSWIGAHEVVNSHTPFSMFPVLKNFFTIKRPSRGGAYTLNRGLYDFGSPTPYANVHAAGYRAIYDMSDMENSLYIQSTGQSGNIFSPHYDDFASRWSLGLYVNITIARSKIEREKSAQTLRLLP